MESSSPKLSVEALEIAQRLDSDPNLRADVEESSTYLIAARGLLMRSLPCAL